MKQFRADQPDQIFSGLLLIANGIALHFLESSSSDTIYELVKFHKALESKCDARHIPLASKVAILAFTEGHPIKLLPAWTTFPWSARGDAQTAQSIEFSEKHFSVVSSVLNILHIFYVKFDPSCRTMFKQQGDRKGTAGGNNYDDGPGATLMDPTAGDPASNNRRIQNLQMFLRANSSSLPSFEFVKSVVNAVADEDGISFEVWTLESFKKTFLDRHQLKIETNTLWPAGATTRIAF